MLFLYNLQTSVVSKDKPKSKKSKVDGKQQSDKKKEENEGWKVFCDFHEITHAVIKEKTTVTIYRQDNMRMVSSVSLNKNCDFTFKTLFYRLEMPFI